jgi:hypothetical protein
LGHQLNTTAVSALLTAAILFYQSTSSDFSEYLVQTLIKAYDDDPNEEESSDDDNLEENREDD